MIQLGAAKTVPRNLGPGRRTRRGEGRQGSRMKRSLCEDCGWICEAHLGDRLERSISYMQAPRLAALRAPFGADYWALASLRSKWQSCAATGHHIRVYRTIIPARFSADFRPLQSVCRSWLAEWSILLTLGGYSNMDLSCVRFVDV
jgi:hypothetical protein